MMPNQLVMVIARPINLNLSCKLHPYSLQRTRSPPEPCLLRRIGNTHLHNYYNLKDNDTDVHFTFLSWGIILWIELPRTENPVTTCARHTETLDSCFDLFRSHQQCIPWSPLWRSNQQPQNAEPKLYHRATNPHRDGGKYRNQLRWNKNKKFFVSFLI